MPSMITLNTLMEQASVALRDRDYTASEAGCLEALAIARAAADFDAYARILLPLQEARRQRRMIAAHEGRIRLGTADLDAKGLQAAMSQGPACVVVTHPITPAQASVLQTQVRGQRLHIELLHARIDKDAWQLYPPAGDAVQVACPAPPSDWCDRWLDRATLATLHQDRGSATPQDWFLDAAEAVGDQTLRAIAAREDLRGRERLEALEAALALAGDHELLHQQLAECARQLARGSGKQNR